MERRKRDRRDLKLICHFSSPGLGDHRLIGVSENISRNGMLLRLPEQNVTPDYVRVGRNVVVEVELPTEHSLAPRCMHCEGRVVRISNSDDNVEVALRFSSLEFRNLMQGLDAFGADTVSEYVM